MVYLEFLDLDDMAGWLPPAPAYKHGDERWISLAKLTLMLNMSDAGMRKMRRRFRNRFEHVTPQGKVFVFGKYWFRMFFAERESRNA